MRMGRDSSCKREWPILNRRARWHEWSNWTIARHTHKQGELLDVLMYLFFSFFFLSVHSFYVFRHNGDWLFSFLCSLEPGRGILLFA